MGSRNQATVEEATPPEARSFADDVRAGLSAHPRTLPCKYLYDERGSALFDEICELDEYYPTRTELGIMREGTAEMAHIVGPAALLVEYGSGSSVKTRLLLDALQTPAGYVPIDISREHLLATAQRLRADYPQLEVLPLVADFTRPLSLPVPRHRPARNVAFFPGSTIGNFTPAEAQAFLAQVAQTAGPNGGLLIGVDLRKSRTVLEPAYDDARGVTAAFNLNLLTRINRELGGTFELAGFRHRAVWDEAQGRVEISLVSTRPQMVGVGRERYVFKEGDVILTEYSHKYSLEGFGELAGAAGWSVARVWTDPAELFSVQYLVAGH